MSGGELNEWGGELNEWGGGLNEWGGGGGREGVSRKDPKSAPPPLLLI